MRCLSLALVLSFGALPGVAAPLPPGADPSAPVREVMARTEHNWREGDGEPQDIFEARALERLFSQRFQAAYREAAKHPAVETENDGPGSPFDYDVITNSQDGCPLKDIRIAAGRQTGNITDVTARFRLWACNSDAKLKAEITTVHFTVITENGRPVIDDILTIAEGRQQSVYGELQRIAKQEP